MTNLENSTSLTPAAPQVLPDLTEEQKKAARVEALTAIIDGAYAEAEATDAVINGLIAVGIDDKEAGEDYRKSRIARALGFGRGANALAMAEGVLSKALATAKKANKHGQMTWPEHRAARNATEALSAARKRAREVLAEREQSVAEDAIAEAAAKEAREANMSFKETAAHVQKEVDAHRKALAEERAAKAEADRVARNAKKPGAQPGNDNASKQGEGSAPLPAGAIIVPTGKVETLATVETAFLEMSDKLTALYTANVDKISGEHGDILRALYTDMSKHLRALRELNEREEMARNVEAKAKADAEANKPAPRKARG
jgi:hypothetical protein